MVKIEKTYEYTFQKTVSAFENKFTTQLSTENSMNSMRDVDPCSIDTVGSDGRSNNNKFRKIGKVNFEDINVFTFVNMTLLKVVQQNKNRGWPVVEENTFRNAILFQNNLSEELYMINVTLKYSESTCRNGREAECLCQFQIKNCKIMGIKNVCKLNVNLEVSFQCYDNRDQDYLRMKKDYHDSCVTFQKSNKMKVESNRNDTIERAKKRAEIYSSDENTLSNPNDDTAKRCLENKLKEIADANPDLKISTVVIWEIN